MRQDKNNQGRPCEILPLSCQNVKITDNIDGDGDGNITYVLDGNSFINIGTYMFRKYKF